MSRLLSALDKALYQTIFSRYEKSNAFHPIIGAVLENKQNGVVIGHSSTDDAALIVHSFGFAQYVSFSNNDLLWPDVYSLLVTGSGTDMLPSLPPKIRLYTHQESISRSLAECGRAHVEPSKRMAMRFHGCAPNLPEAPRSLSLRLANEADIESLNTHMDLGADQRFWRSSTDFLSCSMATVICDENTHQILSVCYAAAVSGNLAEIDIITAQEFRKQGYGVLVGQMFIRHALANGIIPNWDCYCNNHASCVLAEKLGFKSNVGYPFYTIRMTDL